MWIFKIIIKLSLISSDKLLWSLTVVRMFGLLALNLTKRFLVKWRNDFHQKTFVFIKNMNFSYLDYLHFWALWWKSTIYFKLEILISGVTITSIKRQNMYDTKFLWLICLIFEQSIGLIFQYTQLQLTNWCTSIFTSWMQFLTTHVQKKSPFRRSQ